jgi:hypothetical protein
MPAIWNVFTTSPVLAQRRHDRLDLPHLRVEVLTSTPAAR